jgi:hypothetical protein
VALDAALINTIHLRGGLNNIGVMFQKAEDDVAENHIATASSVGRYVGPSVS